MRWLPLALLFSCGVGPVPTTTDPAESALEADTTDAWHAPCGTLFCTRPPGAAPATTPGQYRGSLCGCVEQRGCVAETIEAQPQLAAFAERLGCGAWPQYPALFADQLPR